MPAPASWSSSSSVWEATFPIRACSSSSSSWRRRTPFDRSSPMSQKTASISRVELKACFEDPLLEVMHFLNEVVLRYPAAVSFAPGRPTERYFDVAGSLDRIGLYFAHRAAPPGLQPRAGSDDLGQHNRPNGTANDPI